MEEKISLVALRYPENAECPFVSAKAEGKLAEELMKIAEENRIPVVQDRFLEGILTSREIGESIPLETWEIVAKIFAFISNL